MITTNLLTFNNDKTIIKTLDSISSLNSRIQVIDVGSTDNTERICRNRKVDFFQYNGNNLSEARNKLNQTAEDWILWLEPWEIVNASQIKPLIQNKGIYSFYVVNNGMITKPVRLWQKSFNLRFTNFVYESILDKGEVISNIIVQSLGNSNIDVKQYLSYWNKKHPFSKELIYYKACESLISKEYNYFKATALDFIYKSKDSTPVTLIKYYLASVYMAIDNNPGEAIRLLIDCLSVNPLMAEFWCLLGDIHLEIKQIHKAYHFYQNALLLGKRRLKNDSWPIEINKYKTYPEKMISTCKILLDNMQFFAGDINK
jgi:tetratricopeptide (TPR) repeat protein